MFKTDLAYENWVSKYRYVDEKPIETFQRAAKVLASVEKTPQEWYDKFLKTLLKFDGDTPIGLKCTLGGRILANIGTDYKKATLLNCFINSPVTGASIKYDRKTENGDNSYTVKYKTDDSPDDLMNIFLTVMEQAKTLASEGGYGINFDFIRPRGTLIKGTGIKHPGVVSYMKIWDSVSECIVKGTNDGYIDKIKNYLGDEKFEEVVTVMKAAIRKGAMMGVLSCQHPDCEEFIRAKQTSGTLTKFNMSVLVDDEFMTAVENNDFYEQTFDGKVFKKIKARDLYDLMMESCYNRAEPGILYVDNMHRNNPLQWLGKCTATNPCGEVPGLSSVTTVCLLGSLNITQYVEIEDGRPYFDWKTYKEDIMVFTRMLDNVNEISYNPLPSYDWAARNIRQIGMGINGLGSALVMLKIPYNSPEAVSFAKELCETKENLAWQASALLAKEKGTVPIYDKEKFENTEYFKSDRINEETKELIRKYGVRNGKTTTNPPLGNTSVVCDNVSNGIEPLYKVEFERKVVCNWPEGLNKDNIKEIFNICKEKDYTCWKGEYQGKTYYYEPHNRGLCEITILRDYGYSWLLEKFPDEDCSKYLITTKDLDVDDHINIQEVVQFYCNQSTSKTCNLPASYPFKKFKDLYIKAWKKGLNGFTTYRDGSMESVLSDIDKANKLKEIIKRDIQLPEQFLNGPCKIIKREGKKFYIHFSYLPEDNKMTFPVCMWIISNAKYSEKGDMVNCNKAARELAKLALKCGIDEKIVRDGLEKAKEDFPHNRLGRMISLNLRHNVPREDILVSLMGIEGDYISSLLTAVRKFLGETITDGTKLKGIKCDSCKGDNVVIESGCKRCLDCNNIGCG